jgi:hypothetical protein
MPAAVRIDSGDRNEALAIFARFASEPIPLNDPTFGVDAQLTTALDSAGSPQPIIASRAGAIAILPRRTTAARPMGEDEQTAFDQMLPQIARGIQSGAGGIHDPLAASHIATLLDGTHTLPPAVIAASIPTVIGKLQQNIDRYVTPAISAFRLAHTEAVQQSLTHLDSNAAMLVRINATDRKALPLKPRLTVTQNHGDESLFVSNTVTNAKALITATDSSQLRYIDARGNDPILDARLSTDDSARLLTSLDPSRNVDAWREALTDRKAEDATRSIDRSGPRSSPDFTR